MKHEELIKMSAEELRERLKTINNLARTAEGVALRELLDEAKDIQGILTDAANRAALAGMAAEASAHIPEAQNKGGVSGQVRDEADRRGEALKAGRMVNYSHTGIFRGVSNTMSTANGVVLPGHTAPDVRPTFENVSSLIDRVRTVPLVGGETYKRGFVKSYGTGGGATAENANYSENEPTFGYAEVKKEKVTAYTEEPEEMIKLPNADYDGVVQDSVRRSVRRFLAREIVSGNGSTGHLKGIFWNPASGSDDQPVIDTTTDISVSAITAATLDEIIYSFGGEEETEDIAVLILNKADLKAFAMLRDRQDRKVYTIVNRGNTGTIDSVPYIINSACLAISASGTATGSYCMAYGPLENYELAIFSELETKMSEHYKFKQGQTAYSACVFAGGTVAAWNGFQRVKKAAAS